MVFPGGELVVVVVVTDEANREKIIVIQIKHRLKHDSNGLNSRLVYLQHS